MHVADLALGCVRLHDRRQHGASSRQVLRVLHVDGVRVAVRQDHTATTTKSHLKQHKIMFGSLSKSIAHQQLEWLLSYLFSTCSMVQLFMEKIAAFT